MFKFWETQRFFNAYQSSYVIIEAKIWVWKQGLLSDWIVDGGLVEPDGQAVAQVVGDGGPAKEN